MPNNMSKAVKLIQKIDFWFWIEPAKQDMVLIADDVTADRFEILGCISLLLPILPKLLNQWYANGLCNLGNMGSNKEIQPQNKNY